jgi:hypothetical protein
MKVSLNHTLPVSLCYNTKSSNHTLILHGLTSCTLLQLRTSAGSLLPRTDSSLNRKNSVIYIAEERRSNTGNTCHVTTTHSYDTSPRTRETQPHLLLCPGVFTELLPGNAFIISVTICISDTSYMYLITFVYWGT